MPQTNLSLLAEMSCSGFGAGACAGVTFWYDVREWEARLCVGWLTHFCTVLLIHQVVLKERRLPDSPPA